MPGFFAIAAAATMLSAYSGASSGQNRSPEQPIHFPHPLHVQTLKMNCLYCHYAANKSFDPGMPAMSTCMGCHTLVATNKPEIKKLTAYWNKKEPVPWLRIHKLPEYVHFPHMRHVNAGVSCHGKFYRKPLHGGPVSCRKQLARSRRPGLFRAACVNEPRARKGQPPWTISTTSPSPSRGGEY